ncbi:MAG: OmpA family protein [Alphaproteobacteria bacterium]|nr:OmpA family protein [Alphaproteobacteria bacterium]
MADNIDEIKEDWLVTYADAITLLMAFFVMLLTFAEYDIPAFEEAAAAIARNIGNRDETSPTSELQIILQDVVYNMEADQVVTVTKDKKGLVIELASNAFFIPGTAEISVDAAPVLQKMAQSIGAPRYDFYLVEAEGHTDDDPISTEKFPSNWELSAGRASAVVRFFSTENISAYRMKASGFAATRPKVPNRELDGTPIRENQAVNRRVNIRVFPMSLDQRVEIEELIAMDAQLAANAVPDQPVVPAETEIDPDAPPSIFGESETVTTGQEPIPEGENQQP